MSSSSPVELDAPAKLNLFLEVLGRRPDGYHEIDSVFAEIDLCDRVLLSPSDSISLIVEGGEAPADRSNLAWRAAAALGVGASIRLIKRIPPGAGLGGGSSDAAAVLRGLNDLYALGHSREELARIGAGLGADVPFFLWGGTARCRGRGELVQPLKVNKSRRFLLICPEIAVSTAQVYGALESGLTVDNAKANVFCETYLACGPRVVPYYNRLQVVAERMESVLGGLRERAERQFGVVLTMTGSGAAYFSEIEDNEDLRGEIVAENGVRARYRTVVSEPRG